MSASLAACGPTKADRRQRGDGPISSGGAVQVEVRPTQPVPVQRLKRRPDFIRASNGRKAHSALFTIQCMPRADNRDPVARVGFTVTKKVGSAVERNRIKRRLRALVQVTRDLSIKPSHDYVIVARRDVLTAPFSVLTSGLKGVVRKLDMPRGAKPRRAAPGRGSPDHGDDAGS